MLFFAREASATGQAALLIYQAYLESSQHHAFLPYRPYRPGEPTPRAHRCAYYRTLDSASVRCPSCGAPR
jgi:hypothetical protein